MSEALEHRARGAGGRDGVARRRCRARPAARARHRRRRPRVPGDPKRPARALARAARRRGVPAQRARSARGGWSGPEHAWHVDLVTLRDDDILADLAAARLHHQRDGRAARRAASWSTRTAGATTSSARLVRMVTERALEDDPLRSLRAVRIAVELGLEIDAATGAAAARHAAGDRAGRVRAGVRRAQAGRVAPTPSGAGSTLMEAYGLTAGRAARADRAARGRAEPLPPPRRARPHARGARQRRAAAARPGRRRARRRASRRCSPSRCRTS